MSLLKLSNVRLASEPDITTELYIENQRFVNAPASFTSDLKTLDMAGRIILPGLIETHIHLDKACIMERCRLNHGTLQEAISETSKAKSEFTEDDIYRRGAKIIEKAIIQGTTYMRTHVEIDPVVGLKGFRAINRLKVDFSWALTIEVCVFPQEGLLNNPGTEELLRHTLESGADVLGGCPYMDTAPIAQLEILFGLALEFDRDLDFHLDFSLDPQTMLLSKVIELTRQHSLAGRVTVGHVTALSALKPSVLGKLAEELFDAGVQVTSLPSTDLFLNGRDSDYNIPRGVAPLASLHACGVTCSISSNNIGNPFTPFGDASLIRQANLFANISHLGTHGQLLQCMAWISTESAKLLRLRDYGLTPGCWADFIVFDAPNPAQVIAEIQAPLSGFKRGQQTFERPVAQLLKP